METHEERYLLVFESYNQAMLLYNELLKKECKVELVSTPCRVSRGCSQSIVFTATDIKKVIEEIKKNKVIIKGIYKIVKNNGFNEYVHI
ncbi:MAG: DUF3343 domain-containing protein [Clostridiaceae bacterium]|nr:DUF3343 domain-containing protein [Clostridiaceae bacterium]